LVHQIDPVRPAGLSYKGDFEQLTTAERFSEIFLFFLLLRLPYRCEALACWIVARVTTGKYHAIPTSGKPPKFTEPLYRAFGFILICAGILKFALSSAPAFSMAVAAIPNWALPLVPLFEILLGGWLVSDWMRFGAWIASLLTLLIFAIHNLELLSAGRSSCGCLGSSVDTSL